jgi:hypothetical protein
MLVAGLYLVAAATSLRAQQANLLVPGAVVRWSKNKSDVRLMGRITSIAADTIAVSDALAPGRVYHIAPASTHSLEVRGEHASRRPHVLTGAIIGAGTGVAFGMLIPVHCQPEPGCSVVGDATGLRSAVRAAYGVGAAVAFGAIGAIIGSVVPRGSQWHLVNQLPAGLSTTVVPLVTWRNGAVVGLHITF